MGSPKAFECRKEELSLLKRQSRSLNFSASDEELVTDDEVVSSFVGEGKMSSTTFLFPLIIIFF
jgi:hypothetical protein